MDENLSVTPAVASRYGALKLELWSAGRSFSENGLWIAATAVPHGRTVVTTDGGFDAVPGLPTEDRSKG